MSKIYLIVYLFLNISCNEERQKSIEISSNVDSAETSIQKLGSKVKDEKVFYKLDSLSKEERVFLNQLSKENEFIIISNQVERFYSGEDSIPLVSKIIFSKDFLQEKGYVFLEVKFYGRISDVNISYSYSLGQASFGFGSIAGNDFKDYLHTLKSCGVTTCITQVFQNGEKIFEKNN